MSVGPVSPSVDAHRVDGSSAPEGAEEKPRAGRRRDRQPVDQVTQAIRQDLADGVYSPHERLVEADLVVRYAAPRAAVREALIQLASEGLVEREPNRGARVRGMLLAEAIEMAEVRRALETVSVGQAARLATDGEREAIVALAEALCDAARTGAVGTYLRLNARFHTSIALMARHATAQAILGQFQRRPIDRFLPEPFLAVPPTASVEAHRRIAATIAAGDPDAASAAMYEHLTDLVELLRRYERGEAGRAAPTRQIVNNDVDNLVAKA